MQEWLTQVIEDGMSGALVVPLTLLAGFVTALCSGCNYAAYGAVAGFAASRKHKGVISTLLICAGFFIATGVCLAVVGAVAGSVRAVGSYGKIIAGLLMVLFGLITLEMIPFTLPKLKVGEKFPESLLGGLGFGATVGMASAGCTFTCKAPLLWLILGSLTIQSKGIVGASVMTLFALGYSIPLTLVMLGVSFGRTSEAAKGFVTTMKVVGGLLLVGMGFWFLFSV